MSRKLRSKHYDLLERFVKRMSSIDSFLTSLISNCNKMYMYPTSATFTGESEEFKYRLRLHKNGHVYCEVYSKAFSSVQGNQHAWPRSLRVYSTVLYLHLTYNELKNILQRSNKWNILVTNISCGLVNKLIKDTT